MTSPPSRRSGSSASAPSAAARLPASARLSAALAATALLLTGCGDSDDAGSSPDRFDSDRASDLIEQQVDLGERPAGSPASRKLAEQLRTLLPNGAFEPVPGGLRNVVGSIPGEAPAIVVGAHYDTEAQPPGFVGANDGAAGTAAVVELATALEDELPEQHREIRFVLFDGEEEPPGCPDARFEQCGLRGSKAYVAAHAGEVGELILLDYIANEGVRLPREANSSPSLWERLRQASEIVGTEEVFPPEGAAPPYSIVDDHIPFIEAGVPSIDLIDFSYRYADTVQDTPDKLSASALDSVGETVAELVIQLSAP